MIVYADILFFLNFIIDYLILYSTSKATYIYTKRLRLVSGAVVGGIYGVFMFEKDLFLLYNPVAAFVVSLIIIFISFEKINFKLITNFYIISFSAAGTSMFLNNMFGVIRVNNGLFYVENNIYLMVLGVILSSMIVIFVLKMINRSILKHSEIRDVEIFMENKSVTVSGITDTGNLLLDPITQYPVIVVSYNNIKQILPDEINNFLKEGNDLSSSLSRKYINKIRLIPYKNASSDSILKGFKPDLIIIRGPKEKIVKDVIIAVTYTSLSRNNEFSAILNPQF